MNEKRFQRKNIMITGGGSGIGLATVRRFAQEGAANLYVVDRVQERLDKITAELESSDTRVVPILEDLTEIAACHRVMEKALSVSDRLDVLVSNASAWTEEPFIDLQEDSWHRIIAVNLTASFVLGQSAARVMAKAGSGVILYTASISALGANRGFSPYNVTKAGIVALAKSMGVELAPYNIRVNAVSPGGVDTQMSIDHLGEARVARLRESFPAAPMMRLAQPEEIASVFAFLASDDASYITGANFLIDGGLTAQIYDPPK